MASTWQGLASVAVGVAISAYGLVLGAGAGVEPDSSRNLRSRWQAGKAPNIRQLLVLEPQRSGRYRVLVMPALLFVLLGTMVFLAGLWTTLEAIL